MMVTSHGVEFPRIMVGSPLKCRSNHNSAIPRRLFGRGERRRVKYLAECTTVKVVGVTEAKEVTSAWMTDMIQQLLRFL
jgi:hypothetical protein